MRWYEARRPGLGNEFAQAVDDLVSRIIERPLAGVDVRPVMSPTPVRRIRAEIVRLRRRARDADAVAISNIAANYRLLGCRRLAFVWWVRGAAAGDGEDLLEVAYCFQHGLGVRRNTGSAESSYLSAIRADSICAYSREEAMYHLATLLLGKGRVAGRRRAISLLKRAAADRDYSQADVLLSALRAGTSTSICCCRRGLARRLRIVCCPVHRNAV